MKNIILCLLFFLPTLWVSAQKRCGHLHIPKVGGAMMTDPANLRSDTLNIESFEVTLDMTQMNNAQISGHCLIQFTALMDNQDHILLDLEGLTVDSVSSNGVNLIFSSTTTQIWVGLPSLLNTGDTQNITVSYHGSPIQDDTWGGFYFNSGYAFNLGVGFASEPHNYGRIWHPCFDNFVEKASYTFHVLTNNGRTAYCNGLRQGVDVVGQDSLLSHWHLSEPIPSYLASVSVANYVHATSYFENTLGLDIPIYLAARPQDTTNMKLSMANLVPWLNYAEEKYGPYNWPRVGYCAVPFNGGAMEHATNIAYPLYALDGTLDNETLMAHELAHHWWGDWVTCETAGDMWINEGMASFSEALFIEGLYGQNAYKEYVRQNFKDVLTQAHRRDGGYFALADIPSNITYGDHVYNKGALIGHNLRGQLGDDEFFALIQSLMSSYGLSHIGTLGLRDYWQSLTTQDVSGFFENWILQPGLPEFRIFGATPLDQNQWQLQVEQHAHHTAYPCENVSLQITAVDENGLKWRDELIAGTGTTIHNVTLPSDFNAQHFYLNENESTHFAVLGEEKWISTTGNHDADFAEMDIDIINLGTNDSIWIRVENHWAAVDEMQLTTGYRLSTDRWWNVMVTGDGSEEIEGDIRYYGASNQVEFNDPTFFLDLFAAGFNEDSLLLLYRADLLTGWTVHTNFDVITTPGLTNGTGRIHINGLQTGAYCWGYRDPSNSLQEMTKTSNPFQQIGQQMHISCPHEQWTIQVYDATGRLIQHAICMDGTTIDMSNWAHGQYTFRRLDQPTTNVTIMHTP